MLIFVHQLHRYQTQRATILGTRVEWCKSRARADRFTEEVSLLTEEMLWVLRYLEWKEKDWKAKGDQSARGPMSNMETEGYRAYAERQGAVFRSLRNHFMTLWKDLPAHVSRMQDIIKNPSLALPGEFTGSQMHSS